MTTDTGISGVALSWRRRLLFRVAAVLFIYGIIEFAAWSMMRVARPAPKVSWAVRTIRDGGAPFAYMSHPYAFVMPVPGYTGWRGIRQHNALGFRGREIAVPKPPGVFRIVCLGGSTTYSDAVARPEESFPAEMAAFLRTATGNHGVEVVNAGIAGATSAEVVQTVAFRVWRLDPDVLLLHTGINDANALHMGGGRPDYTYGREPFVLPRYASPDRLALWSPAYRALFTRMWLPVRACWGFNVDGRQGSDEMADPAPYRANLETIIHSARGRGVGVFLVNEQALPESGYDGAGDSPLGRMRAVNAALSARYGLPLCNYETFACPREHWVDGVHLDAAGCRLKAAFIGRWISKSGAIPPKPDTVLRPGP